MGSSSPPKPGDAARNPLEQQDKLEEQNIGTMSSTHPNSSSFVVGRNRLKPGIAWG